jgi:uncharacterized integral membrane protein
MVEEHGPEGRGRAEESNGGPVKPGAEPPVKSNGNGNGKGNGDGHGHGPGRAVANPGGPGTVIAAEPTKPTAPQPVKGSRVSGLWVALTLSAVVLLFLLIFILQNNTPTEIRFFGAQGTVPVGVALLFSAALGILLVAIPGYLRILQLRRQLRKRVH